MLTREEIPGADRLFFSRSKRRSWTGPESRPRRRLSSAREFVARAVAEATADDAIWDTQTAVEGLGRKAAIARATMMRLISAFAAR
jgi:hypothetical protein